jgi:hypothetical protein
MLDVRGRATPPEEERNPAMEQIGLSAQEFIEIALREFVPAFEASMKDLPGDGNLSSSEHTVKVVAAMAVATAKAVEQNNQRLLEQLQVNGLLLD